MATNFDKALYQAPEGFGVDELEPEIEIEMDEPEDITVGIDGIEIEIEPSREASDEFNENLAEVIDEGELQDIASELIEDYEEDVASRKDWMQTYVDGLELLGMKIEDRSEPWEGACGVYHPLLSEALVKFQSETIMETFPAAGPVKTKIVGKETIAKRDAAERVREDMNYQLTEVMVEYRPEHERMLWGMGLSGNGFKKVYFDPSLDRQVSFYVPAEDVVVPYGASNLETAPRVTHVMRKTKNEMRKLMVAGFYRDIDLPEPENTLDDIEKKIAEKMGFRASTDDRYKLLEIQVYLDLAGYEDKDEKGKPTGIGLPYIVTIEKTSQQVLAVRRNWHPEDQFNQKRSHFVHYPYIPGFGFYAFGLIHLIGAFAKSGTSIIRQLVDAGTLSNLPGGLKTKGMRVKGDDTPIAPGEFRDVDVASGTIRDNILPLPYKEPSQVLLTLMNQIVEEGRRFASAADLKVADMSANSPVGTTLAILERSLKVMSAVQARIHYAMKQELKLLKDIIRDYTPDEYSFEPEEGNRRAKQSDYDQVDVIPVSDPNSATMAQKVVQYQAVMQMAQASPQIYDMVELNRQMLDVLGVKNIGKLVPTAEDQKPKDPVSENMAVMNMKPVKAFLYQDHQAHIQVHTSAMQDPKIAQLMGQNPNAQAIQAAMMAHINEHMAYEYRKQIEEQLGVPMDIPNYEDGETIPEEMEVEVSRMMAMAASKLLQKDQAEAAQQQAQQTAQDPLVQMQQQELQIKQQELQLKQQKLQMDAAAQAQVKQQELAIKQQELEIKKMQLQVDAAAQADKLEIDRDRIEAQKEIAGVQVGAKTAKDKAELDARMELEGVKLGSQISKDRMEMLRPQTPKTKGKGE
jgi:hypothetical protein